MRPWLHFSYDNSRQRMLAGGLLAGTVYAVLSNNADCPSWTFGIACPACGMSRAVSALLDGQLMAAFSFNPMFPYWLFIAGAVLGSILLFALGLLPRADTLGKRVLDGIPAPLHLSFWLVSFVTNAMHYGFNHEGWAVRAISAWT